MNKANNKVKLTALPCWYATEKNTYFTKLGIGKLKLSKLKPNMYSHLSNKRDVTLTDFGKFHPAQNKNPPCTFIDFITDLSIFLQNFQYSYRT